jgi:microcystin-dependent protein
LTNRAAGVKSGEENHVLSLNEMAAHNHGGVTAGGSGSLDHLHSETRIGVPGYPILAEGGYAGELGSTTSGADRSLAHEHWINSAGSNWGHNNMPPFLAIPAYIYAGA